LATVLKTEVAILDLELGFNQPNGIDAYDLLKRHNYKGKIFFLTGHGRNHPLVQKARDSGAVIWEKPMDGVLIADTIRPILPAYPTVEIDEGKGRGLDL
jgi:FixJ family two-component response regulator